MSVRAGEFPIWISTVNENSSDLIQKPDATTETLKKAATTEKSDTRNNQPKPKLSLRRMVPSSSSQQFITGNFHQQPKLEFKIRLGGDTATQQNVVGFSKHSIVTTPKLSIQPRRQSTTTQSNKPFVGTTEISSKPISQTREPNKRKPTPTAADVQLGNTETSTLQQDSAATTMPDQGVTTETPLPTTKQAGSSMMAELDQGTGTETPRQPTSKQDYFSTRPTLGQEETTTTQTPSRTTSKQDSYSFTKGFEIPISSQYISATRTSLRATETPSPSTDEEGYLVATSKPNYSVISTTIKQSSSVGGDNENNEKTSETLEGIVWDVKAVADEGFGVLASRCASYGAGLVSDGAGGCTKPVTRPKNK